MRTLLAGGDALFMSGLRHLLEAGGHTVVGSAEDGLEAQVKARVLKPDVILMDLHIPGCGGLEVTRRIKPKLSWVKIILLSDSEDDEGLCESIRELIYALLTKSEAGTRLLDILPGTAGPATLPLPAPNPHRGEPA